jgi:hypothetical protein
VCPWMSCLDTFDLACVTLSFNQPDVSLCFHPALLSTSTHRWQQQPSPPFRCLSPLMTLRLHSGLPSSLPPPHSHHTLTTHGQWECHQPRLCSRQVTLPSLGMHGRCVVEYKYSCEGLRTVQLTLPAVLPTASTNRRVPHHISSST